MLEPRDAKMVAAGAALLIAASILPAHEHYTQAPSGVPDIRFVSEPLTAIGTVIVIIGLISTKNNGSGKRECGKGNSDDSCRSGQHIHVHIHWDPNSPIPHATASATGKKATVCNPSESG